MKIEGCDTRKKYVTYWRKKKKKKKNLVATGFEPRMPAWESNVTTTAPAHYGFEIESSFYIITYRSYLDSNQKLQTDSCPRKTLRIESTSLSWCPNLFLTSSQSISRQNNNLCQSSCTTIHNSETDVTGCG